MCCALVGGNVLCLGRGEIKLEDNVNICEENNELIYGENIVCKIDSNEIKTGIKQDDDPDMYMNIPGILYGDNTD